MSAAPDAKPTAPAAAAPAAAPAKPAQVKATPAKPAAPETTTAAATTAAATTAPESTTPETTPTPTTPTTPTTNPTPTTPTTTPAPTPPTTATTKAAPPTKTPPPAPVSADALALQYQRVGHELAELLAKRGTGHALDQCNDLDTEFHTIKINEALATPESRITAAAALAVLHDRILRWQGIQMARACLDNPLAPQCQ